MSDSIPAYLPNLSGLDYDPQNFRDLYETEVGGELWGFLKRPDNVLRMETASQLERAALEPLASGLVTQFGDEVRDDRTKQMLGHMTRQVMEARGYELVRTGVRITRPSLFTTAATYRPRDRVERPMRITAEQRQAWLENTARSTFNVWLDAQVKREDGTLDLEKLYEVAERYGITKRYDRLNPGQQRMNIGVMLRSRVPAEHYDATA